MGTHRRFASSSTPVHRVRHSGTKMTVCLNNCSSANREVAPSPRTPAHRVRGSLISGRSRDGGGRDCTCTSRCAWGVFGSCKQTQAVPCGFPILQASATVGASFVDQLHAPGVAADRTPVDRAELPVHVVLRQHVLPVRARRQLDELHVEGERVPLEVGLFARPRH